MSASDNRVLDTIRTLLDSKNIEYRLVEHPPTHTSAESAAARGEPLSAGAKALVMKGNEQFSLFVLPADRKVDSQRIKERLSCKKLRFATTEELWELTGLVPGSVPPFGRPVLPLDLYVDPALRGGPRVAFNAGSLTTSIILDTEDYVRVVQPTWLEFSLADSPS